FFRPGELPAGYRLPAHERLAKRGTTFVNHRINSCVCTPSRSVLYTGQHIQRTRMFDNTNFPWIESMSPEIPTLGHLLRGAGYYTAYKGKWHLTKHVRAGGKPTELKAAGIVPDMAKRGAVRSVYDGRYVFARYFSPKQHHRPETLEELRRHDDLELFDTAADPLEMENLAMGDRHRELVLAMNEKLNQLVDAEVGEDRGQMLPGGVDAGWEVTAETMAP
ncbi:MAG TPA: sulfatase-like hydrolase/transferase, partial [Anaeromyxobacteraceae bacterium]|nr:sulfatase-like hydrolase/transferase [Anaeromyxobacteraceae bacterium]